MGCREAFGASLGETVPSADLGGSSTYSAGRGSTKETMPAFETNKASN